MIPGVAGSSPVSHPIFARAKMHLIIRGTRIREPSGFDAMFSGTEVPPGKHEDGVAIPLATPFVTRAESVGPPLLGPALFAVTASRLLKPL